MDYYLSLNLGIQYQEAKFPINSKLEGKNLKIYLVNKFLESKTDKLKLKGKTVYVTEFESKNLLKVYILLQTNDYDKKFLSTINWKFSKTSKFNRYCKQKFMTKIPNQQ